MPLANEMIDVFVSDFNINVGYSKYRVDTCKTFAGTSEVHITVWRGKAQYPDSQD